MYIEIPQVAKCCYKLPLKLGSLMVAVINEVVGTLIICAAIYNINFDVEASITNFVAIFTQYTGLVFSLLLGVCLVVTASLLIMSLFKENHKYILPFFMVELVVVLMNVVGFFIFLVRLFSSLLPNALYMLFFVFNGGFSLYCFIVVYSYYREVTWSSTIT